MPQRRVHCEPLLCRYSLRAVAAAVLVLGLSVPAAAGPVIPIPEFSQYEIPDAVHPAPRGAAGQWLDLGALTAGLVLAALLVHRWRSRWGLYLLAIGSLAWLGCWRKGCICPIGAIQNVALAACDSSYPLPWTVLAFFVLPLIFTLFFGRTFCAAVCPLGAVQELVAVRPLRVPRWLDQALGLLAHVYLGAAVALAATGTAFVICRYDPFVGFFRLGARLNMVILGAVFLVGGMLVGRPYCRYLCPYGAILGLLSRVARRPVRIPPDRCTQCRLCEEACPYGAIRPPATLPDAAGRLGQRRRLGLLLGLLPVVVLLGAGAGWLIRLPLSRLHPAVGLAERVRLEELGEVEGTTEASQAFYDSGRSPGQLYAEAAAVVRRMGPAAALWGAWVGLAVGIKLIHLSLRWPRTDYHPDPAQCVACGRCFWYCPEEHAREGIIFEASPPVTPPACHPLSTNPAQ